MCKYAHIYTAHTSDVSVLLRIYYIEESVHVLRVMYVDACLSWSVRAYAGMYLGVLTCMYPCMNKRIKIMYMCVGVRIIHMLTRINVCQHVCIHGLYKCEHACVCLCLCVCVRVSYACAHHGSSNRNTNMNMHVHNHKVESFSFANFTVVHTRDMWGVYACMYSCICAWESN